MGVTRPADALEELSAERMKTLLSTFTTNRFAGVFTGILAIALLESSSVTIIMVIAVVSSGVLTFVQSLVVVLGSNIGTAPYLPAVHRFDANPRAQSSPWSPGRGCIFTMVLRSTWCPPLRAQ